MKSKNPKFSVLFALIVLAIASFAQAQTGAAVRRPPPQVRQQPMGEVDGAQYHARYVRLGQQGDGLLYEPAASGPKGHIALVFAHPGANNFNARPGIELAQRGYRILMVNYRGGVPNDEAYLPTISRGVAYMRTLPGVTRVVVVGHSGGGHLIPFYQNVAENGSAVCKDAGKIYPCQGTELDGMEKADGMLLLDPTLGAFHQMSSVDPAVEGNQRIAALDMFTAANGYDLGARKASYTPEFTKRFYAAQSARNKKIIDEALVRLQLIELGKGEFSDNEPLTIRGMGVNAAGARLYQPDLQFVEHTRLPRTLLKADGTSAEQIVHTVRPPSGQQAIGNLDALYVMTQNTTVRDFLSDSAVRTGPNFAMTADNIVDVDWRSAMTSTPANAEGITVPSLVLTMGCHYLIVPGEIIFEHLAAKDKTYASVEGATHGFQPCGAQYGDTTKRTFAFVDDWLTKSGRF
jgi:pimeloyl-ACP methyl ester carboxylesterase